MKALNTALGPLAAAIAVFAFPLVAQAEYLVPPGNSAATQYTEAVPTAGGPKAGGKPKHNNQAQTPDKVLGAHNVKRLEAEGPQGQAAAEVAAATAPSTVAPAAPPTSQHEDGQAAGQGASKNGSPGGDTASGGSGTSNGGTVEDRGGQPAVQAAGGSSGLGEVIGQATGSSSSGQLGLLLPLIVLATLAWAVAFVLRRHRQPTG
ncbi:MAG TPA: hypothetical protein VF081_07595 [Solirubrobacterales bacterium]